MKNFIIGIITILISSIVYGQKTEIIYLEKGNNNSNYYIIIYPEKLPWKGYLFLIPSFGETPERVLLQTELPMESARKGILTIIPIFKTGVFSMGVDSVTQNSLKELLYDVTRKHKLADLKFFLGGFSIGGSCAIKYAESAFKDNYKIKPQAVFAIDPPLDFERFYNSCLRDIRLSVNTPPSQENVYLKSRFEELMGGSPEINLNNYYKLSPYSFSDTTQSAIKNLLNVPLRIYSEPDVNWWLNRGEDFSSMNILDCSVMINELNRLGNKKAELLVTENKGFRKIENKKHPHSWTIVDNSEILDWLLK